jgi:hypothetical protein
LKKAADKLGMSLGALLQSQILGQILGAILGSVLGWALNKFFNWIIGLIGDEVAKPVVLNFKALSAKPWGNADEGGVHTKSASGTGIGFQFTYQWTAWK